MNIGIVGTGMVGSTAAYAIAAGVDQKPGESRLELLGRSASIFADVIAEVLPWRRMPFSW